MTVRQLPPSLCDLYIVHNYFHNIAPVDRQIMEPCITTLQTDHSNAPTGLQRDTEDLTGCQTAQLPDMLMLKLITSPRHAIAD